MKYVIESAFEDMSIQKIMQLGLDANGQITNWTDSIEDVEELNSDYINENFGELQDEAYQRGFKEGYDICGKDAKERWGNAEYQRGLNDAWEAARKIIRMPDGDILDLFPDCYASVCTAVQAILKYDASEAIAKLKAYEDKRSDRIEVGDEVIAQCGKAVVTALHNNFNNFVDYLYSDGDCGCAEPENLEKTGKHYDIASILEAMRK